MNTRKIQNRTIIRWVTSPNSKRPYVVERHENCIQHLKFGVVHKTTSTTTIVGRYATELAAERAARRSGADYGGVVQGLRGIIEADAKPPVKSRRTREQRLASLLLTAIKKELRP